jgi:hypothetical protein
MEKGALPVSRLVKNLVNGAARSDAELEALMVRARGLRNNLSDAELDRIGDLALRIMQDQARAAGAILPGHMQRSYFERSEGERQGARSALSNVLSALILLDFIDQSGA